MCWGCRTWAIWNDQVYDLTDYFYTQDLYSTNTDYAFLSSDVEDVFKQQSGQDITKPLEEALAGLNATARAQNENCLNNVFYAGETDFRKSARCLVQNYMLLVFSGIMMASMGMKCECFAPACPSRLPAVLRLPHFLHPC